jgi:diguanylate cyclase (GGDEF)-like protein
LKSRFGRRLLLLFLGCSLLPMTVLAVLSFGTVTRQLREGSLGRLEHTGRSLAAVSAQRLHFLDGDMSQVKDATPCPARNDDHAGPACDGSLNYALSALSFVPDGGTPVALFGAPVLLPTLAPRQEQALDAGQGVVTASVGDSLTVISFVRRVTTSRGVRGLLVGAVYEEYLWGTREQNPLIPTMQLHIVDSAGQVLFRSIRGAVTLPARVARQLGSDSSGTFEWDVADEPYLAAYAPVLPPDGVANPAWMLVLSEGRAAAVAPMAQFRRTFPWVALASLAAALLLTLGLLRRHLAPLHALQVGTQRLANQQFDEPVKVSSSDEFADLAESFNAMAGTIARQFKSLAAAAEADQAVLSSVDTPRIVATVLDRMRNVCACDLVTVTLLDSSTGGQATTYLPDPLDPAVPRAYVAQFRRDDASRLLRKPQGFTLRNESAPPYLAPVASAMDQGVRILPLIYQGELLGAIALGAFRSVRPDEDDLRQAERVAGQVVLALANARMVDQIRSLAYFDSLTGLPNRVSFKRKLTEELERSGQQGLRLAVCFLDLDHFSRINDTLGHRLGDRLVQEVAHRVRACCHRHAPAAEVARLGGDEFTVIVPDLTGDDTASQLGTRLLESFNTPFALDGHEVFISASIGIAEFPGDGTDLESLLKNADLAMYQAKKAGRNTVQSFATSMGISANKRLALEGELRRAIDLEQFTLWYQPVVDLKTGKVASAEALVRWEHPSDGLILPAEFIPLCEETGLINVLGEWILRAACCQNRSWEEAGLASIPMAINVSGQQLRGGGTVELVRQVLKDAKLDPRHLILELTESTLMEGVGDARTVLPALSALGVGLAIDDFGTGYSSLSYLKHFPVNMLKIDKSFVRDVTSDPNDAAITSAIVAMGHALDLRVVAEGVETEAQVDVLRRLGCDQIQGHWVSHPMTANDFARYLRQKGVSPRPPARQRATLA